MNTLMTIVTNSITILIPALITYFLAKRTYKHEVIFRKFHETRAEVIQTIWTKITKLGPPLKWAGVLPSVIDTASEQKEWRDCSSYWKTNRIFLDEQTNEKIKQFLDKIYMAYGELLGAHQIEGREPEDVEGRKDFMGAFRTIVHQEIPPLEEYLEKEFKRIIGTNDRRNKLFGRLFY